mmetsp:Transcript_23131/g.36036  ORF Transcript_23131/g.36036 Transcript_23131/m.36036 type:complete len:470 (-) Transcript_23131:53-1462(-)
MKLIKLLLLLWLVVGCSGWWLVKMKTFFSVVVLFFLLSSSVKGWESFEEEEDDPLKDFDISLLFDKDLDSNPIDVSHLFTRADVLGEQTETREVHLDKDPDTYRNFSEVVEAKGYPCEFHEVTTEDGYILGVYRIPYGIKGPSSNRPPVLVQHGLLDWSFTWIMNSPNESLPYILADAGYDVWMGNNRGTTSSRKHQTLTVHDKEFWNFSWDQMASRDLPAMIQYIMTATNVNQISYVGHSQGTIQMFAALSESSSMVRDHINVFIALAPVAYVGNVPVKTIHLLANKHIADVLYLFGIYQFLGGETECMRNLKSSVAYLEPGLVDQGLQIIMGHDKGTLNHSRFDVLGSHEPGDTSTINMNHWAQGVRTGTFRKYDFGPIYNQKFYGTKTPPAYNLSNIPSDVPIALFSGGHDKLADPADVQILADELPGGPEFWSKTPSYDHLDFVWAVDAATVIYPDVLAQLAKYN